LKNNIQVFYIIKGFVFLIVKKTFNSLIFGSHIKSDNNW
jgi:hypothetical protein